MTAYVVHTKTAIEASTFNEKTELMRQYFETLQLLRMQSYYDSTKMTYVHSKSNRKIHSQCGKQ